jgi:hypothetical protein
VFRESLYLWPEKRQELDFSGKLWFRGRATRALGVGLKRSGQRPQMDTFEMKLSALTAVLTLAHLCKLIFSVPNHLKIRKFIKKKLLV